MKVITNLSLWKRLLKGSRKICVLNAQSSESHKHLFVSQLLACSVNIIRVKGKTIIFPYRAKLALALFSHDLELVVGGLRCQILTHCGVIFCFSGYIKAVFVYGKVFKRCTFLRVFTGWRLQKSHTWTANGILIRVAVDNTQLKLPLLLLLALL